MTRYQTRLCSDASCGLRFPVAAGSPLGAACPHCGAPTGFDGDSYVTHEARDDAGARPRGVELEVLLDNIRSLRNVGSMFRTADGVGVRHLHLGGFTPTPEHPRMAKTSLGAERAVPWTAHRDGVRAATELRARGLRLWALDGGPRSESLFDVVHETWTWGQDDALALVLGHEVSGVDPRIVDQCERVVQLPMLGVKGSLNVSVAFAVAVYTLRHGLAAPGSGASA
ncbi:MAG: hypothetical protein H6713_03595 [Myxococcales bacterium]|nr:hypothetical protein [Myxococcales bacterium]MCB9749072.1 hypothetical protein [Myxococcales bacterium]